MNKLYKLTFELNVAAADYIKAYQGAREVVKIDEENIKLVDFDFKFKNISCINEDFAQEDELEILADRHKKNAKNVINLIPKVGKIKMVEKGKEIKMDGFTRMLNKMSEGELTEKVQCVIDLLKQDIKMPTRTIMKEVDDMWEGRITVSERYVQRIRKWYKEKEEGKESIEMNHQKEDVFNSGLVRDDFGLQDWEINILNMANEGGWSVQQIAETIDRTAEEVKDTLLQNKHMISSEVLDEEISDVYFDPTKSGLNPDYNPDIPPFEETEGKEKGESEPTNDEFWEVKIDCVTACSKTEKEIDVFMSKKARNIAMSYMKWAKNREWLAYLIGDKDEKGFYVHDLYLPDQRTSAVLVDKVIAEKYNKLKIIGVIHSHHNMGAGDADNPSFSGHDTNFINGNHDLSLLAGRNNGGFKVVGIARAKTPCNALMKIKANVKAMKEKLSESENALKDEFFSKVFNKKEEAEAEEAEKPSEFSGQYHFTDNPEITRG